MNIQRCLSRYRVVVQYLLFGALLSILPAAGSAQTEILINFDVDAAGNPITAPQLFSQTNPLRDTYASLGVNFAGPSADDGGAILQEDEFARSGSNVLAFNANSTMANGGRARDPETIQFDQEVSEVSIFASGSFFDTIFFMTAFNAAGDVITDTEAVSNDGEYVQLNLAGTGIRRIELAHEYMTTPTTPFYVYDDLAFRPSAVVPGPGGLMVAAFGWSLVGLACRRKSKADRLKSIGTVRGA